MWNTLDWSGDAAPDFRAKVTAPLRAFLTSANIDIWAGVLGLLLPFRTGGDMVRAAYDRRLFHGATLQDLPADSEGPRFVVLATNYQLNSLWRFSRPYAADYRVGMIANPDFSLAKVVAASSGFPPVFCPIGFDLRAYQVQPLVGADMHAPPYTRYAEMADGGIYDNMGLEPIWKRYGVLLISNAGDPFKQTPRGPRSWPMMLLRILGMIHRQAENNRVRWLMALAAQGQRKVAYWPLRNEVGHYPVAGTAGLSAEDAAAARREPVRLWALKADAFRRLYHHGYSLADAAAQSYLGAPNQPAAVFPPV